MCGSRPSISWSAPLHTRNGSCHLIADTHGAIIPVHIARLIGLALCCVCHSPSESWCGLHIWHLRCGRAHTAEYEMCTNLCSVIKHPYRRAVNPRGMILKVFLHSSYDFLHCSHIVRNHTNKTADKDPQWCPAVFAMSFLAFSDPSEGTPSQCRGLCERVCDCTPNPYEDAS